jgi:hypothetical protein
MITVLLSLLVGAGAPTESRPATTRPDLSWAESDALTRKLEAIEKRPPTAKPEVVSVSEVELDSYLNLGLGPRMPPGLTDVDFQIDPDRLGARAIVDLDQLRDRMPPTGTFNPISYLRGRVPVVLRARFPNGDGFGTLDFEEVRLGGYPIPVTVLAQMVQSSTRTPENPQGFDIMAPFRLPYAVRRVRLQAGKALLEF